MVNGLYHLAASGGITFSHALFDQYFLQINVREQGAYLHRMPLFAVPVFFSCRDIFMLGSIQNGTLLRTHCSLKWSTLQSTISTYLDQKADLHLMQSVVIR